MSNTEFELDNSEIVTLVATFGICVLAGLEQFLPDSSIVKRRTRNVENAIKDLASLQGRCISEEVVRAASVAWNKAMMVLEEELRNGPPAD